MDSKQGSKSKVYRSSNLWKKLGEGLFEDVDKIDLNEFRSPGRINNRLASWDPFDKKTYRYYKNILYNLVAGEDERFDKIYRNIGNTQLGNPIEICVRGQNFNLDYVFSVQEIMFLSKVLKKTKCVIEIGAGFGRTCHSIINNFSKLQNYTIIDIPEVLELSKKYLQKVLDAKSYHKIIFLENHLAENAEEGGLYINIDSMQEMDQEVSENYLKLIDKKGDYFYTRNAICKYNPSSIGLANYDRTDFNNAISTGLCQNVIDIFNSDDLKAARIEYLEKYKPSIRWNLMKQEKSMPWQYYHHALYQRKHDS